MGKNDRFIELLEPWDTNSGVVGGLTPPFLVLVTGDMGREKMLVTHIHYTTQIVQEASASDSEPSLGGSGGGGVAEGVAEEFAAALKFKKAQVATHLNVTRGIL
jgi:hypothetical protein